MDLISNDWKHMAVKKQKQNFSNIHFSELLATITKVLKNKVRPKNFH